MRISINTLLFVFYEVCTTTMYMSDFLKMKYETVITFFSRLVILVSYRKAYHILLRTDMKRTISYINELWSLEDSYPIGNYATYLY